jgi:Fe(3+) dicitrate transport protein
MVKTSYFVDPDADVSHELRLKLGYFDEVSNETYLGLSDADFRDDPYQRYALSALDRMQNHRTSIVASHVLDVISPEIEVTTSVYRHDFHRIWRKVNRFRGTSISSVLQDPEELANAGYYAVLRAESDSMTAAESVMIGPNDRTFVSQGVQSVASLRADTGPVEHRLQVGARLHYDSIERKHSEQGYVLSDGLLVPEATAPIVTAANSASSLALALHALDAITWGPLTLTPGVRLEAIQSESDDFIGDRTGSRTLAVVMPGAGAYYALTEELGVLAGVYRGFSPPPPGSSSSIKPEHSWNFEAGGRFTHSRARTELIAFVNDYQNLTDVCTVSNGCVDADLDRQFDAGEALIYGFEALSAYDAPAGDFTFPLKLVYTLTHAEFGSDFQSDDPIYGMVQAGDAIPYVPRHQLNASAGVEHALAGAFASLTFASAMREEAGQEPLDVAVLTDEQLVLDLGASVRPLSHLSFYFTLHNALDARDIVSRRPYGARPNAPRWLHVGMKLEL